MIDMFSKKTTKLDVLNKKFVGKDIISISDFTKEEIIHVLEVAKLIETGKINPDLSKKIMAALFFEPSTRTRLSFEAAMNRLGGKVLGFSDAAVSSTKKGETLHDTIKMVERYSDVIVMRHNLDGAARVAADTSTKPVINAGDGANQHPTQTFLDLYTIKKTQGKLTDIKVAFVGDLKYGRTVHSLVRALTHFKCKMYFVSPDSLKIQRYYLESLKENGIQFSEHKEVEEIIGEVDVLYMTRIQKERFPDPEEYEKVKNVFRLHGGMLANVKPNLRILHPLPRVNEIAKDVDSTKYAHYFEQAANGVPVRQALLALVLGAVK